MIVKTRMYIKLFKYEFYTSIFESTLLMFIFFNKNQF